MATWIVGDIHGCYETFMTLIHSPEIKQEDIIVLIGDMTDRGPNTWEILQWAIKNVSEDGRYQLILGNHESVIIQYYRYYLSKFKLSIDKIPMCKFVMHKQFDFAKCMMEHGAQTFQDIEPIVSFLRKLPIFKWITVNKDDGGQQEYLIVHGWCEKEPYLESEEELLYGREVGDSRFPGKLREYKQKHNEILIHGHTPTNMDILSRHGAKRGYVWERNNCINIDCGCVYARPDNKGQLAAIRLEDRKIIYTDPLPELNAAGYL